MLINLEQENMQISVVENQQPEICFKLHHMHLWCLTMSVRWQILLLMC